jgi:hypothetical protein
VKALEVLSQNDGYVTKAYYRDMEALGTLGHIAVCLFRAQKRSARAKDYRRGKYRRAAYDVKAWSMQELCKALTEHAEEFDIRWGWKEDSSVLFGEEPSHVLYVDLPGIGQCSFHNPSRMEGPEYKGEWSGIKNSDEVIVRFCGSVAALPDSRQMALESPPRGNSRAAQNG